MFAEAEPLTLPSIRVYRVPYAGCLQPSAQQGQRTHLTYYLSFSGKHPFENYLIAAVFHTRCAYNDEAVLDVYDIFDALFPISDIPVQCEVVGALLKRSVSFSHA